MRSVYTASVMVNGLKVYREFEDQEMASMWVRMMTAQYLGRIASPVITRTCYSEIFHTPMTNGGESACRRISATSSTAFA